MTRASAQGTVLAGGFVDLFTTRPDRRHLGRERRARLTHHVGHRLHGLILSSDVTGQGVDIARRYGALMESLAKAVDVVAGEHEFSGVVSVERGGEIAFAKAYGLAHRALGVANTLDTRFAIASGTKGLTALAVVSLVERGVLDMSTTARSVLGDDLPLVDDRVTVEHLLAHRSGIGDYFDEEDDGHDIDDYLLPAPVHRLAATEEYLAVLDGYPTKFAPDARFSYCNSGYVVLALIAERASGVPFHDLVRERVCAPAGMRDTEFFRSDQLPGRTALGYLPAEGGWRTNVFHLPVRGNGDGGVYSTVADVSALWRALVAGRIVPPGRVAELTRTRSAVADGSAPYYGLGFWLHGPGGPVMLIGMDTGVSFQSVHDPGPDLTYTVVSNTSDGAWPLARCLREQLS